MEPLPSNRHHTALSTPTAFVRDIEIIFARGDVSVAVEPDDGGWTQDARRSLRWDGICTVSDDRLIPSGPADLLTPFGTTAAVSLGIILADGSSSTVPFGVYVVDSATVQIAPASRSVTLGLIDLGDKIAQYRFEEPLTIAAGTDVADAVNAVVTSRTGESPNLDPTTRTLARQRIFGLDTQTDPWRELEDLADSFGMIIYYDRTGTLQLVDEPTPDLTQAIPVTDQWRLTGAWETRPPNVVVARGEPSDGLPPVQGVAIDDDPSSPTYAGTGPGDSPYGRITRFFASPLLTNQSEVDQAAESILRGTAGGGAAWRVGRPFDPTWDPWDILTIPDPLNLLVDAVTVTVDSDTVLECRAPSSLQGV